MFIVTVMIENYTNLPQIVVKYYKTLVFKLSLTSSKSFSCEIDLPKLLTSLLTYLAEEMIAACEPKNSHATLPVEKYRRLLPILLLKH